MTTKWEKKHSRHFIGRHFKVESDPQIIRNMIEDNNTSFNSNTCIKVINSIFNLLFEDFEKFRVCFVALRQSFISNRKGWSSVITDSFHVYQYDTFKEHYILFLNRLDYSSYKLRNLKKKIYNFKPNFYDSFHNLEIADNQLSYIYENYAQCFQFEYRIYMLLKYHPLD